MHARSTALKWHRRPRAWLVSLALGMLVLMQSLGGAHAVMHRIHAADDQATADLQDSPFGLHAAHSVDCQLFDQLAHADLAWLPPRFWMPPSAPSPAFLPAETPSVFRQARRFRARDPPGQA